MIQISSESVDFEGNIATPLSEILDRISGSKLEICCAELAVKSSIIDAYLVSAIEEMVTPSLGIIKKLASEGTNVVQGFSVMDEHDKKNEKKKVVISSESTRCINGFKPSFFEY